jgi:sigma-B regulation protein RsbU (phosphoserine phosphatase)
MNKKVEYILQNKIAFNNPVSILKYFVNVIAEEISSNEFAFIINSDIISNSDKLKNNLKNLQASSSKVDYLSDYKEIKLDSFDSLFVVDSVLFSQNEKTIRLLITILYLLNENIITENQTKGSEELLDSKIEQLNQLYDLSKEFSGILELDYVSKLIIFSIVGQFLVSDFAIIYFDEEINVLESRTNPDQVKALITNFDYENLSDAKFTKDNYPEIHKAGFELILPMQIKNETKGLILLGAKKNKELYTKYDIEYINSVGSLAIISIENAILFKETLEKQAIERDLETARIIQKNLLPHEIIQPDGFEIAAYSESAKQVGGDYFDLISTSDNETIFAMGDVSGKGITASLLVANSQAYLKSISKQNLPIAEATALLNDLVEESTVSGTYITFFWGILNSQKELTYVNAGHNPPFLIRNGELTKLEKGGLILGMMKTMMPYESEKIQLQAGDYIITFTDGVTEAMNSVEVEYSDERLEELCKSLNSQTSEEAKKLILADVKMFTAGFEQSDDLTLMVIKAV